MNVKGGRYMKWKIAYAHHEEHDQKQYCTIGDLEQSGWIFCQPVFQEISN